MENLMLGTLRRCWNDVGRGWKHKFSKGPIFVQKVLVPGRLVVMLEVEEEAQVQEVWDRTREVRSIWGP